MAYSRIYLVRVLSRTPLIIGGACITCVASTRRKVATAPALRTVHKLAHKLCTGHTQGRDRSDLTNLLSRICGICSRGRNPYLLNPKPRCSQRGQRAGVKILRNHGNRDF